MIEIESFFLALGRLVARTAPRLGIRFFNKAEKVFGRLARMRETSILGCGLAALALRAAMLPILLLPVLFIQDEFSYLMAADTFAHGPLTNPTPPLWTHFETFQVLFEPTSASDPQMPGLIFSRRQRHSRPPFVEVWLSLGMPTQYGS